MIPQCCSSARSKITENGVRENFPCCFLRAFVFPSLSSERRLSATGSVPRSKAKCVRMRRWAAVPTSSQPRGTMQHAVATGQYFQANLVLPVASRESTTPQLPVQLQGPSGLLLNGLLTSGTWIGRSVKLTTSFHLATTILMCSTTTYVFVKA
jgi:hypothetical protein